MIEFCVYLDSKTDYVVRPSTCSERDVFREQEKKRYMNPHKAYSFRMHGFESVVGPVKVCYPIKCNTPLEGFQNLLSHALYVNHGWLIELSLVKTLFCRILYRIRTL